MWWLALYQSAMSHFLASKVPIPVVVNQAHATIPIMVVPTPFSTRSSKTLTSTHAQLYRSRASTNRSLDLMAWMRWRVEAKGKGKRTISSELSGNDGGVQSGFADDQHRRRRRCEASVGIDDRRFGRADV